jgi:hypothetical protein
MGNTGRTAAINYKKKLRNSRLTTGGQGRI